MADQRNPRRLRDPGGGPAMAPSFIPLIDLAPGNIVIPNQCTLTVTGTPSAAGSGRDAVRSRHGTGDTSRWGDPPGRATCFT